MSKLARIVIVGRTNVGKSTLFNRLSENVKSLAFDYEGVTRDFLTDMICWQGICFELVDSGGISSQPMKESIDERARLIALNLIDSGDLVLFMVDGVAGVMGEDRNIAQILRKKERHVIVLVNKIDTKAAQDQEYEFSQLGFDTIIGISGQHGLGIDQLLEMIITQLKGREIVREPEVPHCRVALLGKPNVGKSSLMNKLLNQERTIVTDIPGTTREAITEPVSFYQQTIAVTDTPGVRRMGAVQEPLEQMMVKRTFRAIEHANIVLLLIDGSEKEISNQELKLAFYAFEKEHKALILLINKDDLIDEDALIKLEHDFEYYQHFIKKVPQLFISCITGKNIGKILSLINTVWNRYVTQFSDQELTEFFKAALVRRPLYHSSNLLRIRKVRQLKTGPITLALFVNHPEWFGQSQLAYFENQLRRTYDLIGVPIRFVLKKG